MPPKASTKASRAGLDYAIPTSAGADYSGKPCFPAIRTKRHSPKYSSRQEPSLRLRRTRVCNSSSPMGLSGVRAARVDLVMDGRFRHRGRNDDDVEGRSLGYPSDPSELADSRWRSRRGRIARARSGGRFDNFHRIDLRREPREDRGLVTRSGPYFQHPLRPRSSPPRSSGRPCRAANRLSRPIGNGAVVISVFSIFRGHKAIARHRAHRLQHALSAMPRGSSCSTTIRSRASVRSNAIAVLEAKPTVHIIAIGSLCNQPVCGWPA